MEYVSKIITLVADWLWGPPLLILLVGGGLFLTVKLGFFQFRYFPYAMQQTFGKIFAKSEGEGTVTPFQAACSALASSVGAANIVGVPTAIALGGPGAVFWMWLTAMIGMATKFSEIVLGMKYREKNAEGEYVGGPAYYLQKGIKGGLGKALAVTCSFFFMLEIVPSISVQTLSICDTAETVGIPKMVTAVIVLILVGLVVFGGIKRIGQVTEKLVPVMALVFVLCCVIILGVHVQEIPAAFVSIFKCAFSPQAAVGGFSGSVLSSTIRWGVARGAYSNEAGMGSAPYAHSAATTDHPVRQGLWGIFEVFVDTIVICTMTALVILTSGVWKELPSSKAAAMPATVFQSVFGVTLGGGALSFALLMFVLSTIIVIVFYCEKQAEVLFGLKFAKVMRIVCLAAILYGAVGEISGLYALLDFLLGFVVIANMIGVIMLSGEVKELMNEFFNDPKYYKKK